MHGGAWLAGQGGAEVCGHQEVCGETPSPSQEPVRVRAGSSLSHSAGAPQVPAPALVEVAELGSEMCQRWAPWDLRVPMAPSPAGVGGWVLHRQLHPQLPGRPPPRAPAPEGCPGVFTDIGILPVMG